MFSLGRLKVLQEVTPLSVFVPFPVPYIEETPKLDYPWVGL